MVVCLVLELEQPFLLLSVHVDVDVDAAGVVLLALLEVVELAMGAQPAGSDGRQLHQTEALMLPAELLAHAVEHLEGILELTAHERIIHGDLLDLGGKCRVTAVVAPIGVKDTELGLEGIAAFALEILHDLSQVVVAHRQSVLLAESVVLRLGHRGEAAEVLKRLDVSLLAEREHAEVLGAALDGIDEIMPYTGKSFVVGPVIEDQQARTLDLDFRGGVDEVDAVHGRRSALVELAGDVLHGDVFLAVKRAGIGDRIGHHLAEDAVPALLQQFVGESEEVINVDEPQGLETEREVLVELCQQA